MPIIFMEGFELYPSVGYAQDLPAFAGRWSSGIGQPGWYTLGTSKGRFGSKGISFVGSSLGRGVTHNRKVFLGEAFYLLSLGGEVHPVMRFSGIDFNLQVQLQPTGHITIQSDTTIVGAGPWHGLTTTNPVVMSSVWNYLEVLMWTGTNDSQLIVRLNGVNVINSGYSATDIGNWTYFTISQSGGLLGNPGGAVYFDDIYMLDATGVDAGATFLGDVRVQALRPENNGDASEMDRVGGDAAGNYTAVDDVDPDGDTSYVNTNVLNEKDLYHMQNLTDLTTQVIALCVSLLSRKDEAGARSVAALVKTNDVGNTITQGANINLLAGYVHSQTFHQVNPVTGLAWTPAEVNALQAGVKLTV